MFLHKSLIYISLLGLHLGGCSTSNNLSSDWQYYDPKNNVEYLTSQLIKSCNKDVDQQIQASETVMELIVRNGVNPSTGQLRSDLDENLYQAGVNLYLLNLGIMDSSLSVTECQDIALLIQRDLLSAISKS